MGPATFWAAAKLVWCSSVLPVVLRWHCTHECSVPNEHEQPPCPCTWPNASQLNNDIWGHQGASIDNEYSDHSDPYKSPDQNIQTCASASTWCCQQCARGQGTLELMVSTCLSRLLRHSKWPTHTWSHTAETWEPSWPPASRLLFRFIRWITRNCWVSIFNCFLSPSTSNATSLVRVTMTKLGPSPIYGLGECSVKVLQPIKPWFHETWPRSQYFLNVPFPNCSNRHHVLKKYCCPLTTVDGHCLKTEWKMRSDSQR